MNSSRQGLWSSFLLGALLASLAGVHVPPIHAADPPPEPAGGSEPPSPSGTMSQSPLERGKGDLIDMPAKMPDADALAGERLDGAFAFDVLKNLEGTWTGRAGGDDGFDCTVVFHVTAGGKTIIETQFPGTDHEMVSVYYLDGKDLVLTHYCAMGNQPRMRFNPKDSTWNVYSFEFDGGTNLKRNEPHVHEGAIHFVNATRLKADWHMFAGGKRSGTNSFDLVRAGSATPAGATPAAP
jgi:hypothetical protein